MAFRLSFLTKFTNAVFIIAAFWGLQTNLNAQNLEQIGKQNPLTISGGVSVNQIGYAVSGIESRRDPYSFFASGNVNFNLYGWSVPLTFTYSNQQGSFQQPFNQFGLHPTYKWVTGHFGYASMNFSPYTLGGHLFLGAGAEASPGKFKISAMYGRLMQAVEPDTLAANPPMPAFKRMGWGIKAGYADGNDQIYLILFGAKDDVNSIRYVPEEEGILPEENLVVSLIGSKALFERVILKAEYSISGISRDTRSQKVELTNYKFFNNAGSLFTPNLSSSFYNAFNAGVDYQANTYSVGFRFEKIDPRYRTLGAYFFNNDLINYTVNGATSLFKGKINLAANVGIQKDNLDNTKISSMNRTVGSINVGLAASKQLNLTASYSNFTSFTNIRSQFVDINQGTPYENLDTLNFTQISQNASLNANYRMSKSKERPQNINVNLSFQDAADKQGDVKQNSGSQFYLANAAYSFSFVPQTLTVTAAFNYNENKGVNIKSTTVGPTIALGKSFLEKQLRTSLSTSWNQSYTNGEQINKIINVRASAGYSIKKKHNLNLSLIMVNRASAKEGTAQAFTEYTGTLGYSYNFNVLGSNK